MTQEKKEQILKHYHITDEEWHLAMRTLEVSYLLMPLVNFYSEENLEIFRKGGRILGYVAHLLNQAKTSFNRFNNELKGCITDGDLLIEDYENLRHIIINYLAHEEKDMDAETRYHIEKRKREELEKKIELLKKGMI